MISLDDAAWTMLLQNVADEFNDLTIKRGFQYFKQDRILQLTMLNPKQMEAVIEGRSTYHAKIDLDNLGNSECSCPVGHACKHIMAALLKFADNQGRSVHHLVNAKSPQMLPRAARISSHPSTYSNGSGTNVTLKSEHLKEKAQLLSEMSVMEWHEWIEQCTADFKPGRQSDYARHVLSEVSSLKPSLSSVLELLFGLHVRLFILKALSKQTPEGPNSFGYYTGHFAQFAAADAKDMVEDYFQLPLPASAEPERVWQLLEQTSYWLRHAALTESPKASYFGDAYELLWICWISPMAPGKEVYQNEIRQLELAEEELGASLFKYPWLMTQSRLYFLLSDDTQSWSFLMRAADQPGYNPADVLRFLQQLQGAEDWTRLTRWLVEVSPLVTLNWKLGKAYGSYWDEAIQHLPETEQEMWDTLQKLLPYSGGIYEEKLYGYGKWKLWIDYQLSQGREPLDIRATELKPLEKEAPETLLPFYHQAVERYVMQKNRASYKAAVKLLKRLAKLYKKLKLEPRWEQFLDTFPSRHSRLRALQEELRKGKLIP